MIRYASIMKVPRNASLELESAQPLDRYHILLNYLHQNGQWTTVYEKMTNDKEDANQEIQLWINHKGIYRDANN